MLGPATGCEDGGSAVGSNAKRLTWKERIEKELYESVTGPARSFIVTGVVNEAVIFGHEATLGEREQASRVVKEWMRARSKAAWRKDCSYMSRIHRKFLVKDAHSVTNGKVKNCPQALAYFGPEASGNLVNTMTGSIDSLRVEGKRGYALYHGRGGIDWSVTMDREKGTWKVAESAPTALEGGGG